MMYLWASYEKKFEKNIVNKFRTLKSMMNEVGSGVGSET
jgi:hypothetical protein